MVATGSIHNSYRFWSWGQDIQTHDIKDTSSNTSESCNARLNKKVLTSHQKFPNSAQVVWESHGDVLESYTQIFKHRETPSNKRKLATTQRWDFLTKNVKNFISLNTNFKLIHCIIFCYNALLESQNQLRR